MTRSTRSATTTRRAGRGRRIAKGIVGRPGDVPFVASPAHKHAFDLRSGRCLDDAHASVPSYAVKVVEGVVIVGHRVVDLPGRDTGYQNELGPFAARRIRARSTRTHRPR